MPQDYQYANVHMTPQPHSAKGVCLRLTAQAHRNEPTKQLSNYFIKLMA